MKHSLRELAYGYIKGEIIAKMHKVQTHVEEHPKDEHAAIRKRALEEAYETIVTGFWYAFTHAAAQERMERQEALKNADAAEAITGGESIRDIGPSFDEMEGPPATASELAELFEIFGGHAIESELEQRVDREIAIAHQGKE